MPVVIDYNPAGAVGQLAQQVSNNNNFLRSQELGMQEAQLNSQLQDEATRREEMQQQMAMQQQRMNMEAQAQNAASQPQAAPTGMPAGLTRWTDAKGATYVVSPEQRIQLANASRAISDPDQLNAVTRGIIGVPNMVPVKMNDGSTVYMNPQQAAMMGYHNAQLDLAGQRLNLEGQRVQDNHDYRSARLDQFRADNDRKLQAMNDSATKQKVLAARNAVDSNVKAAQQAVESAQREYNATLAAVKEAAIEHKDFDPFGPAKDGEAPALTSLRARLMRAQGAVDAAQEIREQRVKEQEAEHVAESQIISGGATAAAPAQSSSAAPAPTAQPQGSAPRYTATGPNGQKVMWNGQSWVPAQ